MERISYRALQRTSLGELVKRLPLVVTVRGIEVMELSLTVPRSVLDSPTLVRPIGNNILSAEATAELLKKREIEKQAKGSATEVKPMEVVPWYDAAVHKAGDKVRMTVKGQVRVMTVPEMDADGHFIPK